MFLALCCLGYTVDYKILFVHGQESVWCISASFLAVGLGMKRKWSLIQYVTILSGSAILVASLICCDTLPCACMYTCTYTQIINWINAVDVPIKMSYHILFEMRLLTKSRNGSTREDGRLVIIMPKVCRQKFWLYPSGWNLAHINVVNKQLEWEVLGNWTFCPYN